MQDGKYHLQGDNEDDSWDSRDFGPLPLENIVGLVVMEKKPFWLRVLDGARLNEWMPEFGGCIPV